jgi:hypothetical protein
MATILAVQVPRPRIAAIKGPSRDIIPVQKIKLDQLLHLKLEEVMCARCRVYERRQERMCGTMQSPSTSAPTLPPSLGQV